MPSPAKKKPAARRPTQLRPLRIKRRFTDSPAGSVLIEMGATKLLCTASFVPELPKWRQASGLGWVTAEYSMLPASTGQRKARSKIGHTDGRGTEIQRIVGRVLRSVIDFAKLGPNTIYIDCDVLQADGGTRTAAINGGYVALADAIKYGLRQGFINQNPLKAAVAAVSVGIVNDKIVLDLDYHLDSAAQVDLNVALTDDGRFVEIQGTAEQAPFTTDQLEKMLKLAQRGIKQILKEQATCLK